MMNYEIFKEVVAEKFMDYMPEKYRQMEVRVNPVNKVNVVYDGLSLAGENTRVSGSFHHLQIFGKCRSGWNAECQGNECACRKDRI